MPAKEVDLVKSILRRVPHVYKGCYIRKLADRNSRGLPDIVIVFQGGTLFVETKTYRNRTSAIQDAEHDKIDAAHCRTCRVIVARSIEEVLTEMEDMALGTHNVDRG